MATDAGIQIEFIRKRNFRKEDRVKEILAKRGEQAGLVCIFAAMETLIERWGATCRRAHPPASTLCRQACASLIASSAAGVPMWIVAGATAAARRANMLTRFIRSVADNGTAASYHRRTHRHLPLRSAAAVAARSPVGGASGRPNVGLALSTAKERNGNYTSSGWN
jgi:hypothetical protein